MESGNTTAEQDKAWIKSNDESWQLWEKKINLGFAAPALLVGGDD